MKKVLLFAGVLALISYSCQKDALSVSDYQLTGSELTAEDRGGGHGHGGGHHGDSLNHDSTNHHLDSIHHQHDSTWVHHQDSIHNDTTGTHGGGHHGHHNGNPGSDSTACHVPPATITVAELPQAAQDWLAANQSGATISSVTKFTNHNCKVSYRVKIDGVGVIRFDADGNKI